MSRSVFRSAVTNNAGDVDSGYLAMFMIMAAVFGAIPFMCFFTAVAMWLDPAHAFDVQALGIGIGSVCTGFGVSVGAVGAFRLGDQNRATSPSIVTTTQKETIVQTEAMPAAPTEALARGTPGKPLHVAVEDDEPRASKAASKAARKGA